MKDDLRVGWVIRFDSFEVNLTLGELRRDGVRLPLPEQSFQILAMLLEQPGELVTRGAIQKRLWPNDTVVEFENSINAAMKRLRAAVGDSAEDPRYIQTLPRRGYRWLRPIERLEPEPEFAAVPPRASIPRLGLMGKKVCHYRVLDILGGGGMGVVYRAEDIKLGRRVALKFLPEELASDPVARERFEREARAASRLNHPNICTVYAIEDDNGQPFIAMELLDGRPLSEVIKAGTSTGTLLKPEQVPDFSIQIAEGLKAAHQAGIIHRDIKPANVFITSNGQAKILDFGLAKVTGPLNTAEYEQLAESVEPSVLNAQMADLSLSRTGIAIGTAGYMSPEQVRGEKLDARTDIFSLGLVIYEMCAGQRAFGAETAALLRDSILHKDPVPVRELNPAVPPELAAVIWRAIQKDREARYASVTEMLEALRMRPTQIPGPHPGRRAHRYGYWYLLAGAITLGLVAIIAGVLFERFCEPRSPDLASVRMTKLTDSGVAHDVAISADGRYVVYSFGRGEKESLRLRQIATRSDIEILPAGPEFHGLTFSPDGKNAYFVRSDANDPYFKYLYSIPVQGGSARQLIADVDAPVSFSPDGSQFAFLRAVTARNVVELRTANADGSSERVLSSIPNADGGAFLTGPSWSPDGRSILCSFRMLDQEIRWILVSVSVPDGAMREIYKDKTPFGHPVWLSEQELLLVRNEPASQRGELWTISYPKGKAQRFTNDLTDYEGPLDNAGDRKTVVAVAATSVVNIWQAEMDNPIIPRQITFTQLPMFHVAQTADGHLFAWEGGGSIWSIGSNGQHEPFTDSHQTRWLEACNNAIVFTTNDSKNAALTRVSEDGRNVKKIFSGDVSNLACSPDGNFVYYVNQQRPQKIWRISSEGGDSMEIGPVSGQGVSSALSVSPDGQSLAYTFVQERPIARKLAIQSASGGPVVKTFDVPGGTYRVRWSAAGTSLQYLVTQNGVTNLWEQPVAGGEAKQLTKFDSGEIFDFALSSDHKTLSFTRGEVTRDVVLFTNVR